ncbi:putative gluconolactonase precursor-hypothetical secreted or membrane associated protein [Fimbriiglobus ruber]|uniref:Putative gluconolactonase-hypothetical secreted or membrane associated protein n=1 Tax=Fimbriiglobus ruber TaxID=1908690 RepID=A0A225E065_9BACT|nr:hypothetical protein [Fimbriiglobus ruber]OWK41757.1 putative gluconolactonase precursor-hypothetical secreted or membrane associated protein [Fimbriiglobus ruber]
MRHFVPAALCVALTLGTAGAADDYKLGPDSQVQDGTPKGVVTKSTWNDSTIFPGTTRDYWAYVPAQYKADGPPACVMIFQDGGGYQSSNGQFRAPVVFDNLIHKKEMPVTVGIFINPGTFPRRTRKPRGGRTGVLSTTPFLTNMCDFWNRKSCLPSEKP